VREGSSAVLHRGNGFALGARRGHRDLAHQDAQRDEAVAQVAIEKAEQEVQALERVQPQKEDLAVAKNPRTAKLLAPACSGNGHELIADNLVLAERRTRWRCQKRGAERRHY